MSRARKARLVLYGPDGRKLERSIEAMVLERFLAAALRAGGPPARLVWEQTGMLGRNELQASWPEPLALPAGAYLRSGRRMRTGLALQVEAPPGDLGEYADDLQRLLEGGEPVRRYDTRPLGEEPGEAAAFDLVGPGEPEEQPEPEAAVEVLPPGRARPSSPGRRWRLAQGDAFGLAGPVHPDDALDDGLEIRPEDLAWLNPGDRIYSATRGPCRIVRVEDRGSQVAVRDERGRQLVLRSEELLAEFSFDDGPGPRRDPPARGGK